MWFKTCRIWLKMKKTLKSIIITWDCVASSSNYATRERFWFSQRTNLFVHCVWIVIFFHGVKKERKKLSKEEWKKKKKKSLNIFLHIKYRWVLLSLLIYLQLIDHNVPKKTKEKKSKSNSEKKTFKRKNKT